ncbi:hypothetical protein [Natrinema sp. 1APR25-10V2]|uniref:hypothetical protein n=1 Tax=Natrinema sp. 1APR25-10V2 TaxID=2951081 RepID=UPI00287664EE|nr:hypothetical protein [Natrinema sp. 1APR25-10V2]MDS0477339.1 hypothetical protein [Natrinema sp. 1APR25-10V2]
MQIAIFGATGRTGRPLCRQALERGHTVVRAPRLTEGDPTGEYRAGDLALGFESIDRADVARFILDCLEGEEFVRDLPKVGPA